MDKNRRKFLKILLIGSGTLLVGKIFNPFFSKFSNDSFTKTDSSSETKTSLGDFEVVENEKKLSIYDDSGEEIFQIDKGT